MYEKKDFGKELEEMIKNKFDYEFLSNWAHEKYLDHASDLDTETYKAIMRVIVMNEGEEFEKTKEELFKLAKDLQK